MAASSPNRRSIVGSPQFVTRSGTTASSSALSVLCRARDIVSLALFRNQTKLARRAYRAAVSAITRYNWRRGAHHRRLAIGLPFWFFRLPIFRRTPSKTVLSTVSSMISPPRCPGSAICWSSDATLPGATSARPSILNSWQLNWVRVMSSKEPCARKKVAFASRLS